MAQKASQDESKDTTREPPPNKPAPNLKYAWKEHTAINHPPVGKEVLMIVKRGKLNFQCLAISKPGGSVTIAHPSFGTDHYRVTELGLLTHWKALRPRP